MSSPYHVHHEHERTVVTLTIVAAGMGVVLVLLGWYESPKTIGYVEITAGAALFPLAFGLWRAQEWARISLGCLSLAAFAGLAWYTWKVDHRILTREFVPHLLARFGPVLAQAVFLLIPSTARAFAAAREGREIEREARRNMRGSRVAYRRSTSASVTPERSSGGLDARDRSR